MRSDILEPCEVCDELIAKTAKACPHCGDAQYRVQTIEKTGKDIKIQILLGYLMILISLPVMFLLNKPTVSEAASQTFATLGGLLFLSGFVLLVRAKAKRWWHHE